MKDEQILIEKLEKLGLNRTQVNGVIDIFASWSFDWANKNQFKSNIAHPPKQRKRSNKP